MTSARTRSARIPMATDPTDHELLLLLRRDMEQLSRQLSEALLQLARGNERFERIALYEQEVKISLTSLRQDFSRAMLAAESAQRTATKAQEELQDWVIKGKTIVWLLGGAIAALQLASFFHLIP